LTKELEEDYDMVVVYVQVLEEHWFARHPLSLILKCSEKKKKGRKIREKLEKKASKKNAKNKCIKNYF